MPVGQAVTATRLRGPEGAGVAAVPAAGAAAPGAGVAAGAPTAAAPAGTAAGAGAGPTTSFTSSTTSSAVSALRSALVKAGLTRARASLVSTCRWVLPPPAGAAMRKAMSAGPSLAPKSTFGESRTKASVGSSTPAVRQWGIAMPPGRPVGEVASRARTSSTSWSTFPARPAPATMSASARMAAFLSAPRSASRRTRSVVIRSDIFTLLG